MVINDLETGPKVRRTVGTIWSCVNNDLNRGPGAQGGGGHKGGGAVYDLLDDR